MPTDIDVLFTEDCPNAEPTLTLVNAVVAQLDPSARVASHAVHTVEQAGILAFLGSPSVRVDGLDLEGREGSCAGLSCRIYLDGRGVPPRWLLEGVLLQRLQPRSLLFLCVANSARSQIAEGIARHWFGDAIRVQSAGSQPGEVRPEAVQVLAELGIDIAEQRSKSVDAIDPGSVDTVITLCAEEFCPAYLGQTRRLHWGLADPAAVEGEARLGAFRRTRDELMRRLWALRPEPRGDFPG